MVKLRNALVTLLLSACYVPLSEHVPQECKDFCAMHVAHFNHDDGACSCDWSQCVNVTNEGLCCDENWRWCTDEAGNVVGGP